MIRRLFMLSLMASATLGAGAAVTDPVLLSHDFSTFTAGNLNGQQGWVSTPVNGAQVASGVVNLAANTQIDRSITEANGQTVVWTETNFRGSGTSSAPDYPAAPASAIVHLSSTAGIQPLDGNGTGGGTFRASGNVPLSDPTGWYRIIIRQDYTAKTWDLYVGAPTQQPTLSAQDMGFRDDSVDHLGGFRQYAGVACSMDNFLIRRVAANGDVNWDGAADSSDVVRAVNTVNSSPDPNTPANFYARADADYNGDGSVNATDVTQTVDYLLQRP